MLIDWFTVVAQIVNFLVLVWLLKRFFFGRLVKAIDGRESRIAARLAAAEEKKRQADAQTEGLNALMAEEARKREALLAQARRESEELRLRMIREARETVQALEKKWMAELEREKAAFGAEIRRRSAAQILVVIRRALADLASADLQHAAVQVFTEKLRALDVAALEGRLEVVSAYDLNEDERQRIHEALGPENIEFTCAPEMAWGIELRAGGRRIGWNPSSYLEALEQNLGEALGHPAESALETVPR